MGADIKAIRARIKSVDSTRHITKAMQLVAASKIKRASNKMEASRFYRQVMLDAFSDLAVEKSSYSAQRDRNLPVLYIIIAGDRGLAGGYNNNIFRSAMTVLRDNDLVIPIGKRAVEYYTHHSNVVTREFNSVEKFTSEESAKVAETARDMFDEGKISAVTLIYTRFESMLSQSPDITYLLPLEKAASQTSGRARKRSALSTTTFIRASQSEKALTGRPAGLRVPAGVGKIPGAFSFPPLGENAPGHKTAFLRSHPLCGKNDALPPNLLPCTTGRTFPRKTAPHPPRSTVP